MDAVFDLAGYYGADPFFNGVALLQQADVELRAALGQAIGRHNAAGAAAHNGNIVVSPFWHNNSSNFYEYPQKEFCHMGQFPFQILGNDFPL